MWTLARSQFALGAHPPKGGSIDPSAWHNIRSAQGAIDSADRSSSLRMLNQLWCDATLGIGPLDELYVRREVPGSWAA